MPAVSPRKPALSPAATPRKPQPVPFLTNKSRGRQSWRRTQCWWSGIWLALLAHGASAAPDNITRGEIALLPGYCPDTQTFSRDDARTSVKSERWRAMFGPTFSALHHYCWGLISVSRARSPGVLGLTRQGLLMSAINDFRYVVQHATPDFILLPEIYYRMGETQLELQAYGAALDAFTMSRQAKPDYWPPYARWAEALVKLGKKNEALAHLEQGLRLMPAEPALAAPYQQLGGNYGRFLTSLPLPPALPTPAASSATQ